MNTMSSTPTRRVSLRRKRSTKNADVTGSPVSKKSSPLREDKCDEDSVNCTKSQIYTSRRIRSQPVSSPHDSYSLTKNDDQSSHSTSEEKSFHTPHSSHQQREIEHQRQHSPDTPFICSQLGGTQECEVVWDCNSPGYSKDDLKRMPGGEGEAGAIPVTFIAPVPHRVLFPKGKGRPQTTTSVKSTTAQLDKLLDQLRSKNVKQEESDLEDHKPICVRSSAPRHLQTNDILDDDLFEDDVLTLLDEVESQYGSQQTHPEMSSSQSSYFQQLRCTQDEIARKKEAAQRLRQEKQKQRQCKHHHSVC
ncbi:uncharacterized protein [Panulirus ornatus]|uniref:uncharacterized protein n=1 Tax=Panulirus ornatus TaxID=150431 RepID=UPI003A83D414